MGHYGRLLTAAAAGALVTLIVGGAVAPVTAAEKANIWFVNPLPNTPDWGRSGKIFVDGADAGGYKATLVGPDKIDIPAMISEMEQAITDGADGIITCSLDASAFKGTIDAAKAKGIVVVALGCVDPNATFSVGTGNDEYGRASADIIAKISGGTAQVGILGTVKTAPIQIDQVNGFRAQAKDKYPNIKDIVWESDNSDAGIAAQKIGAMISAYPEMNVLWTIEGAAPGAIPAAFSEAGKKPGEIKVLAIDAQASTLKAIDDGWISATLNQCWFDTSANVAKLIVSMKNGGKPADPFIAVPVDPVTKDSLPYKGCAASVVNAPFGG